MSCYCKLFMLGKVANSGSNASPNAKTTPQPKKKDPPKPGPPGSWARAAVGQYMTHPCLTQSAHIYGPCPPLHAPVCAAADFWGDDAGGSVTVL